MIIFRKMWSTFALIGIGVFALFFVYVGWNTRGMRDDLSRHYGFHWLAPKEPKPTMWQRMSRRPALIESREDQHIISNVAQATTRTATRQWENHEKRKLIDETRPHPIIQGAEEVVHGKIVQGSGSIVNGFVHPRILHPTTQPSHAPATTRSSEEEDKK